ncbi:MAG: PhoH family protein [Acidiferrobacterales bacterium]
MLDTNVLMHDPVAIFRFQEHDIYLPMVVLEELDRGKKGMSEVARNVRQVSRYLDDLIEKAEGDIANGVALPASEKQVAGHLYFYLDPVKHPMPHGLPLDTTDNTLLGITIDLGREHLDCDVALVSKDINLRIKARALGIHAEDYTSDHVLDDTQLLYTGLSEFDDSFWGDSSNLESWTNDRGRACYKLRNVPANGWYYNQFIHIDGDTSFDAIVREYDNGSLVLEAIRDYTGEAAAVWGIQARNREQSYALNLLMEPEIDFVTILGQAGTGKTLLTLAAALTQTLDDQRYSEIIFTRITVPVGEDIGFLPGTEEEKMNPWMGALDDNLEVLHETSVEHGEWGKAATRDFLYSKIRVKSLNFMRGRTFLRKFLIIDEAQNLTPHQLKTLITRAGPGSKVICLGNLTQIDTPYLTETTSGLTYVVDRFKTWQHSGHVTLHRGERSRLADFASDIL